MLLDALEAARTWTIKFGRACRSGSEEHRRCEAVRHAIDDLGYELTGDPNYFALKSTAYHFKTPDAGS